MQLIATFISSFGICRQEVQPAKQNIARRFYSVSGPSFSVAMTFTRSGMGSVFSGHVLSFALRSS